MSQTLLLLQIFSSLLLEFLLLLNASERRFTDCCRSVLCGSRGCASGENSNLVRNALFSTQWNGFNLSRLWIDLPSSRRSAQNFANRVQNISHERTMRGRLWLRSGRSLARGSNRALALHYIAASLIRGLIGNVCRSRVHRLSRGLGLGLRLILIGPRKDLLRR